MSKMQEILMQLGLSDNEANVYLACLKHGASTAMKLAQLTGIKRSTVYLTIDRLVELGLIHVEIAGKKRLFAGDDPKQLRYILEKKVASLENALPELTSLYEQLSKSESLIKHYQGIEGIQLIYKNILTELNPGDYYYVISDMQKWFDLAPEFFQEFIRERAKLDIDIKLIFQESERAKAQQKVGRKYNEKIKLLPASKQLNVNMITFPKKTIIIQIEDPIHALIIENENIVAMNKTLFELIWNSI